MLRGSGLKLFGEGEKVEINENKGVIVDRGDHNGLWLHWYLGPSQLEMFDFKLSAVKELAKEEMIKIARSVSL